MNNWALVYFDDLITILHQNPKLVSECMDHQNTPDQVLGYFSDQITILHQNPYDRMFEKDRIVDYLISFEALFLNDTNIDSTYRISRRIPILLEDDFKKRDE